MTREITAYQRLVLDDKIDSDELCAEAILRGDGTIAKCYAGADWESFKGLMCTDGHDEFKVYKHDFFKNADASEYEWKYEGPVIKFMCDIKKYFDKSGAEVVYILFR